MHRSHRWKSPDRRFRFLALLLLILVSPTAQAQDPPDLPDLLEGLEHNFVVHTLTDGYALQTAAGKGAVLIEVRAGAVAIDGEPVGDEVLRARVGRRDTERLRALSALTADTAALRALRRATAENGDLGGERDDPSGTVEQQSADRQARDQQALEEDRADRARQREAERQAREESRAERERQHEAERQEREQQATDREERDRKGREDRQGVTSKRRSGDRFRLFRDVRVERDETASEAVAVLGRVTVLGEVRSDAVAVGGSVRVEGTVRGDVTAVGGSIILGPDAEIGGDATAVGGEVRRARGARVRGSISEVTTGRPLGWLTGERDEDQQPRRERAGSRMSSRERDERNVWRRDWLPRDWPQYGLGWPWWSDHDGPTVFERMINTGLLIVLTLILLLTARRSTEGLARRLRATPLRATATGLAVQVATLPLLAIAAVVLLVSIIGIPLLLLIPVFLLVLLLASLLGYASVAAAVGRWLGRRLGREDDGPLVVAILGVLAIQGLSVLGEVFDGLFVPFSLLGVLLLVLGFCARYLAWTMGLGAVVLDTFGRKLDSAATPPPPLPPIEREMGIDPVAGWRA